MGCTRYLIYIISLDLHFPGSTVVKNPPVNAGDVGSIPVLGKSPGGAHGSPLQYSCLESPMDRGAWWGHKESLGHKQLDMTEAT